MCAAQDGSWEVYDEAPAGFLALISQRDSLDGFTLQGLGERETTLSFSRTEAKLRCTILPAEEEWLDHFLIDLKKHVLPPTRQQRLIGQGVTFVDAAGAAFFLSSGQLIKAGPPSNRYARIQIKEKPPNAMWEGLKIGVLGNAIWTVLYLLIGTAIGFGIAWFTKK